MKTMMLTDFIGMTKSLRKWVPLYALLALGVCLLGGCNPGIGVYLGFVMPYSILIPLLIADERCGWGAFRQALPLSRADVVTGRYVSIGIVVAGCVVLSVVIYAISCAINFVAPDLPTISSFMGVDTAGLATFSGAGFALALVMFSMLLPFLFALGTTKALKVIPTAFMLLLSLWVFYFRSINFDGFLPIIRQIMELAQSLGGALLITGIVIVAALALFTLSGILSLKLYRPRDL